MDYGQTQGLVDRRYRLLKTGALLFLSFDIFYTFAGYLCANLSGESLWQFAGLLRPEAGAIVPTLLRYTVLGYAIVSLPLAMHIRKLSLAIESPKDSPQVRTRGVRSIESAFAHYRHTHRVMLGALSAVNFLAVACFIAYGEFWIAAVASCIGFGNKLVVFPGSGDFNRWIWRALEVTRGQSAT